MRPALLLVLASLTIPTAVHSLFHILDWFVWGVGLTPLELRHLLLPYFQGETLLGIAMHAYVATTVLVLISLLFAIIAYRGWAMTYFRKQIAILSLRRELPPIPSWRAAFRLRKAR